jgi:hypothetical protein
MMDMLRRAAGVWLLALLCATATWSTLGAQVASQENGRPVASVLQIDSNASVVDGRLDEDGWARAQPVTPQSRSFIVKYSRQLRLF